MDNPEVWKPHVLHVLYKSTHHSNAKHAPLSCTFSLLTSFSFSTAASCTAFCSSSGSLRKTFLGPPVQPSKNQGPKNSTNEIVTCGLKVIYTSRFHIIFNHCSFQQPAVSPQFLMVPGKNGEGTPRTPGQYRFDSWKSRWFAFRGPLRLEDSRPASPPPTKKSNTERWLVCSPLPKQSNGCLKLA